MHNSPTALLVLYPYQPYIPTVSIQPHCTPTSPTALMYTSSPTSIQYHFTPPVPLLALQPYSPSTALARPPPVPQALDWRLLQGATHFSL